MAKMTTLRDVINDANKNGRASFQERLARLAEKTRQREPEYDAPIVPPPLRPVSVQWVCKKCNYIVNAVDTHGWFKNEQTGKEVACPVCSPAVQAARIRRVTDRQIKALVPLHFFNMQNLPPDSAKLTLQSFPAAGDKAAKRLVEQFISKKIDELILVGDPGLGKTGLAVSAVKALTEQGMQALFLPMIQYVDLCREDLDFHNEHKSHIAEIATHVDTLVLDDMGLEVTTKKTVELTQKLIEARHIAGRRTLITSNMDLEGLKECWSLKEYERTKFQPANRTIDRLSAWYKLHPLKGTSLRKGA